MSRAEKKGDPALPQHRGYDKFSPTAMKGQLKQLMEKNKELIKQVESYAKQVAELKSANEGLRYQVTSMRKELKSQKADRMSSEKRLNNQIDHLQNQIGYHKKRYDKLMISQAACLFEQAICSHVLPDVCAKYKFVSIRQLLNYLNDDSKKLPEDLNLSEDDSKRILEEARQKWIDLCRNVLEFPSDWESKTGQGWDIDDGSHNIPDVIRAIGWLKQDRIPIAHPSPVVLRKAEEKIVAMKDSYPSNQFGIIKKFISTSMRAMLERSELEHAKIDLTR